MQHLRSLLLGTLAFLAVSCQQHFITDRDFRTTVQEDFQHRMAQLPEAFHPLEGMELNQPEKEALEFLYAYMPLADVTDYSAAFYLENVRAAFATRELWNVPEREFRHFVLPLRVNNENLDSARVVFARELRPRIEGLSMQDAILEVNHWCHEKVTYQPSDGRTSSPLNLVRNALGRCGEQSTFCVTALRSVGIPAVRSIRRAGPTPTTTTPGWKPGPTDSGGSWAPASRSPS